MAAVPKESGTFKRQGVSPLAGVQVGQGGSLGPAPSLLFAEMAERISEEGDRGLVSVSELSGAKQVSHLHGRGGEGRGRKGTTDLVGAFCPYIVPPPLPGQPGHRLSLGLGGGPLGALQAVQLSQQGLHGTSGEGREPGGGAESSRTGVGTPQEVGSRTHSPSPCRLGSSKDPVAVGLGHPGQGQS